MSKMFDYIAHGGAKVAELEASLEHTAGYLGAVLEENERLRNAIIKTIEENRHLADGENCTLIHLKRAIA